MDCCRCSITWPTNSSRHACRSRAATSRVGQSAQFRLCRLHGRLKHTLSPIFAGHVLRAGSDGAISIASAQTLSPYRTRSGELRTCRVRPSLSGRGRVTIGGDLTARERGSSRSVDLRARRSHASSLAIGTLQCLCFVEGDQRRSSPRAILTRSSARARVGWDDEAANPSPAASQWGGCGARPLHHDTFGVAGPLPIALRQEDFLGAMESFEYIRVASDAVPLTPQSTSAAETPSRLPGAPHLAAAA